MAKRRGWGEDGTDPGAPAPTNDATVVGFAPSDQEWSDPRHGDDAGGEPARDMSSRHDEWTSPRDSGRSSPEAEATIVISNPVLGGVDSEDAPHVHEATAVLENPLAVKSDGHPGIRARLVVVAGKEEGRVIELSLGSVVVGRAHESDITLLDIQISRRHAELTVDHNGVLLTDLRSGNGTFVNEELVEAFRLVHGDHVAIGDHVLRFEEEGGGATALPSLVSQRHRGEGSRAAGGQLAPLPVDVVRRARQRRAGGGGAARRKTIAVAGGGALMLVAFASMAFALLSDGEPPPPPGPSPQDLAHRAYLSGMQSFRDGELHKALEEFEQALAKMPEHRDAERYLRATRMEMAAAAAIGRATASLEGRDYEEARNELRSVSSESLKHQEAVALLRRVDEEEARAIALEGDGLFEDDELEEAVSAYQRALSIVPDFALATRGLELVEEREEELRRMTQAQRARRTRLAQQRRRQDQAQAQARIRRALAVGERQFDAGDFQRAVDTFSELAQSSNTTLARQARAKANAARAFRPAYERGMTAAEQRSAEQAVQDLSVAERHARTVNRNGKIHIEVRERLADMYHLQGRVAYNSQRYQVAYRSWSEALQVSPRHRYASQGMDDLKKIGQDTYMEAYMTRTLNPETAARKFRQVIAMTPPDFDYHQRARQRLQELER